MANTPNNSVTSPASRQYIQDLYRSVLNKSHIDFGDIPKSAGDITAYSGYPQMKSVLDSIEQLCKNQLNSNVMQYVSIIRKAITNLVLLSPEYKRGYATKTEYTMAEYQIYVYMCVEATTSILYGFVDYSKQVDNGSFKITLVNTKTRANILYIDILRNFNAVMSKNVDGYRKVLREFNNKGKNNFIGIETLVGIGAVAALLYSIVPVTRRAIYLIYKVRNDLSMSLDAQAKFLEMNASCLEANAVMDAKKKQKVVEKQKKMVSTLRKISDKLRINSVKAAASSQQEMNKDNIDIATGTNNTNADDDFSLI